MGLIAALWEGYKLVGPQDGGTVFGWKLLPRAKDRVMPHVSDILSRFGDPINRSKQSDLIEKVKRECAHCSHVVARQELLLNFCGCAFKTHTNR